MGQKYGGENAVTVPINQTKGEPMNIQAAAVRAGLRVIVDGDFYRLWDPRLKAYVKPDTPMTPEEVESELRQRPEAGL